MHKVAAESLTDAAQIWADELAKERGACYGVARGIEGLWEDGLKGSLEVPFKVTLYYKDESQELAYVGVERQHVYGSNTYSLKELPEPAECLVNSFELRGLNPLSDHSNEPCYGNRSQFQHLPAEDDNEVMNVTPEKVVKAAAVTAGVVGVALIAPIGMAGVVGMGLVGAATSWLADSAGDAMKKG